jgi:hypothetical protein
MPLFDNSNDIVIVCGAIAGSICSIIAAVRLSRCEYVSMCKGLLTIKRTMPKTKTDNINDISRTPSSDNIQIQDNTSVEV